MRPQKKRRYNDWYTPWAKRKSLRRWRPYCQTRHRKPWTWPVKKAHPIGLQLFLSKTRVLMRLWYDWPIPDNPSVCLCGSMLTVDHGMICQHGVLVIQYHNEIRDLQAELLDMVCYDVHYNLLQAKRLPEGLTKPLMHALTSIVGVSGSDRGLHFSI